jgi:putative redox protein
MVTAIIGRDHYRTEIFASGKTIIADEPEELGGTDLGPAPGEFLMVSLASCTAITFRMYADRKKWDVTGIKVEVDFEKLEFRSLFRLNVYLEGNLDEEQRQRLLQIAKLCPVHKTLANPIEINTNLI